MRRFGQVRSYGSGEALATVGVVGHGLTIILDGKVDVTRYRAPRRHARAEASPAVGPGSARSSCAMACARRDSLPSPTLVRPRSTAPSISRLRRRRARGSGTAIVFSSSICAVVTASGVRHLKACAVSFTTLATAIGRSPRRSDGN